MPSSSAANRALGSVTGILFLTFLDTTIMTVALADVQTTLHAGVSELQWVLNAYALTFASLMLAFGTLSDRLGRKRLMLAGVAVFGAGSLFGALAPNTGSLIAARAMMGIGAAACEPGTLSIIRHIYPEAAARAGRIGVWAAIAGLALALGPVFGGLLTGAGGWRAIFWFNVAAAVVAFGLRAARRTREPRPGERPGSTWAGFVLGPAGLAMIIFAVILGETHGYTSVLVLALFAVGVVAADRLSFSSSGTAARPCWTSRYLRGPAFSGSLAVAFAAYFGVFSIFFLTALYLQLVIGYSPYRTAALFAPMALALIVVLGAGAGFWVARIGPRLPVTVGSHAAGAACLLTDVALCGTVRVRLAGARPGARGHRVRHRHRADHLGGHGRRATGPLRHGGLGDHDQPRGGHGHRRGGARRALQRPADRRPHQAADRTRHPARFPTGGHHRSGDRPGPERRDRRAPAPSSSTETSWPR